MSDLKLPAPRARASVPSVAANSDGLVAENGAVIATNDDATACKLSCVQLGYFGDSFVHFFTSSASEWSERKPPLINRGYYSRVTAVRSTLESFVRLSGAAAAPVQVVTLGAGYDTLYFNTPLEHVTFFELDFPSVIQSKLALIGKFAQLAQAVSRDWDRDVTRTTDFVGLIGPRYRAVGVDLSDVDAVERRLRAVGIDATLPTLVISECVLIYIAAESGDALLRWFASTFANSAVVTYEQIRPDDAFGRMMVENLSRRGCRLETLLKYPTLDAQQQRYLDAGWTDVRASTMLDVHQLAIDAVDRVRAERLEIFDEVEEWRLIQTHYTLVVAQKGNVALDFPPSRLN
jgi:tRNA wybutosine-synthesizing protein 4